MATDPFAVSTYPLQGGGSAGARGARRLLAARQSGGRLRQPAPAKPWEQWFGAMPEPARALQACDGMSRTLSPYPFNPLNLNPLRDVRAAWVDFDEPQR